MEDSIGYLDEIPSQLTFAAENRQHPHACVVCCTKTAPTIERLLANITMSPKRHLCLSPKSIEESVIVHCDFFYNRQFPELPLWRLKFACVPENRPGALMQPCDPRGAHDEH
jgi:hypothetical protein